jgi:hypothetical protein
MLASSTGMRRRSEHRVMSTALVTTAPRSVGDAMAARLRETALLVVACGVAGVFVAGVGRLLTLWLSALAAPEARGALTENGNVVGEITVGGSVALMLVAGVGSAVLGAGAFSLLRPWLPSGPVVRGLVFGGFLFAFLGAGVVDPPGADVVLLGDRAANVALFAGLFVAFGLIASGSLAFLDARVAPAPALSPRRWTLTVLGALPAVPGILGVVLGVSAALGLTLLGASVAMVVAERSERHGRHGPALLIRAGATAALVLVTALAGTDSVEGARTIL